MFSIDKRLSIREHPEDRVWILRIENANYDDAGDYECQVTTQNQSSSQIVNLNVVNISEVLVKAEPVKHLDNASSIKGEITSEEVVKDTKDADKASTDSSTDTPLLLPIISLVSISSFIIVLGIIRTVLNNGHKHNPSRSNANLTLTNLTQPEKSSSVHVQQ